MNDSNYKKRFDELAAAVSEFIATSWTGTDAKGRCTYTDYNGVFIRIEKILGEIPSNEQTIESVKKSQRGLDENIH